MPNRLPHILFSVLVFSFCSPAFAYFQMDLLKNKNTIAKESSRWTLSDWLAQKNRASILDQWLALHHQVQTFEFIPAAAFEQLKTTTPASDGSQSSVNAEAQSYSLEMYLSLLALRGDYRVDINHLETYSGAVGLRLLGVSAQTTSLVSRFGWETRQDLKLNEVWHSRYLEGELQIYLAQSFGLTGSYRSYFQQASNQGNVLKGSLFTSGLFLESGILRLFANYLQERVEPNKSRQGLTAGLKLFF